MGGTFSVVVALAIFGGGALDVFHFMVLVAVLFQVPTLPLVLEEMPAPVGVAWVWFVASAAFLAWVTYVVVLTLVTWYHRLFDRPLIDSFQRWWIKAEGGRGIDLVSAGFGLVAGVTNCYWTAHVALLSLQSFQPDTLWFALILLWAVAFFGAFLAGVLNFGARKIKAKALSGVTGVVYGRSSDSELISMYDCLHAPGVPAAFWEEYRKLRTVRDSTVTNRRFREVAAPYAAVENVRLQRVVVLVAVLAMLSAVLVALPTMVSLLADGASVIDWLRGVFGPPVPSDAR